ncbi:class I SAM-dependent methyltransferase [Gloeobacter morelensis]|uniref:Class I SAM-dependent methyltransferase n=1 Tax=Gloeobacter morelensis MG652769 TaxID=2781736 RepID=A0ABY3PHH5_9CYAN|nr:class I SAM-dependent methyltransferase [Gloeobacter morelensis]UFP93095.1 class I SAM-dependent methyltransferase [Gloeobacter morelensis MG652769]
MLSAPWNLGGSDDPICAIDAVVGEAAQFERMAQLWDANCRHNALVSCDFYCGGFAEQFERNGERIAGFLRRKLALGPDSRLLDLGCGVGRVARYLQGAAAGMALADVSGCMLAQARLRLGEAANCTFTPVNANRLPWPDGSFTHAIAIDLVQHLPEASLRAYFAEVARVLVPGGLFLLTTGTGGATDKPPDPWLSRQLLRLLGLRPLPIGSRTGAVLAELTRGPGPLQLREGGDDFPNQLPALPVAVPFAGRYLLLSKPSTARLTVERTLPS